MYETGVSKFTRIVTPFAHFPTSGVITIWAANGPAQGLLWVGIMQTCGGITHLGLKSCGLTILVETT